VPTEYGQEDETQDASAENQQAKVEADDKKLNDPRLECALPW
jgi:hypothetical protein